MSMTSLNLPKLAAWLSAAVLWVSTSSAFASPAALRGQTLYRAHCMQCHDSAPGNPGTAILAARVGKEQAVLHQRDKVEPVFVRAVVRYGLNIMPPFRPSELPDADLEAIAEYLANPGAAKEAK